MKSAFRHVMMQFVPEKQQFIPHLAMFNEANMNGIAGQQLFNVGSPPGSAAHVWQCF